jgi:hypothetical protein
MKYRRHALAAARAVPVEVQARAVVTARALGVDVELTADLQRPDRLLLTIGGAGLDSLGTTATSARAMLECEASSLEGLAAALSAAAAQLRETMGNRVPLAPSSAAG